ncbi:hypothetical protein Tco_1120564 [Tanacetum coccineum]
MSTLLMISAQKHRHKPSIETRQQHQSSSSSSSSFKDISSHKHVKEEIEQWDHSLILEEDIGYVCHVCGIIQRSIKSLSRSKKSKMTTPNQRHYDFIDSIKSLKLSCSSTPPQNVSPSMDALRDYYRLKLNDQNGNGESSKYSPQPPQNSHPPLGLYRKCKSLAQGISWYHKW